MAEAYRIKNTKYSWNPLKSYPRNALCFCGGFQKAKSCCLPFVPELCLITERAALKMAVKRASAGQRVAVKFTVIKDEGFKVKGHTPTVLDKITPASPSVVHENSGAEVIKARPNLYYKFISSLKGVFRWDG